MPRRTLSALSFVIPVYNEESGIPSLREALESWQRQHPGLKTEILFVNDGSADASLDLLRQWAAANSSVKVVSFSRNFGHQNALSAGFDYAGGEAAVIMDADLQDPLDVVDTMIARFEEGYDVVYGQRIKRAGETKFKRATAWLFYRMLRRVLSVPLPEDTGDFRLVSRACLDAVKAMPERRRFLRGMFAWAGFRQVAVPYERVAREHGQTSYSLRKMISLAWNGITSFSTLPLRLVSLLGLLTASVGFVAILYALLQAFLGRAVSGWTSLVCLIAFIGGMTLLCLGIIGEYIGKIYEEVKNRPLFIVAEKINIERE